jgi:hypothetical protein
MIVFCGMVTIKTSLGPRAYRLLKKFANQHKTPMSEVLTLMILDSDRFGNWVELEELIERQKELSTELRRKSKLICLLHTWFMRKSSPAEGYNFRQVAHRFVQAYIIGPILARFSRNYGSY